MDTKVSHAARLTRQAHAYFPDHAGATFDSLLAPVEPALPAGRSLRGTAVYATIERARRHDDASLPLGAWVHELKHADWDKVSILAADALRHQSKDLQLATWLSEAQVRKHGFAAVAPCMLLLAALCERYWDDLHPQMDNGDAEFRANILRSFHDKLLPALRLVPLTASERERDYCWADMEQARRNEQVQAMHGKRGAEEAEGVMPAELAAALAATATPTCAWLHDTLADALLATDMATGVFDARFGADSPGFGRLTGLLEQIAMLIGTELQKRGIAAAMPAPDAADVPDTADTTAAPAAPAPADGASNAAPRSGGAIGSRAEAYARLAEAADFLIRIEPHSPAPYLVNRAIAWGRMNTADLYQELFIRLGGQLGIFDLLGLQAPAGHQD